MARLVRHRQPKGPAPDRPNLTPPRHISTLRPWIGPPRSQRTTIASTACRPWYVGLSRLEHSAARRRNLPNPGITGRSELLRNKRVMVVHSVTHNETARVAMPFSFAANVSIKLATPYQGQILASMNGLIDAIDGVSTDSSFSAVVR
jgi:hypothetical protein